jgi:4-amino-4-deoxy-L-arabinose transferase-like glycosyltransferase
MSKFIKDNLSTLILILIFLAGAFLRFYNLNWDKGLSFHPDERNINAAYSRINIPTNLDPEFFAYGSAPIYLYRATGQAISFLKTDTSFLTSWSKISLIGRAYSALFSSLLIISSFFLASKLFSKKVALLCALITSFTVGYIQIAHYSITESAITLFGTLICLSSIYIAETGQKKYFFTSGLLMGIATAFKASSLSFSLFPLTGYLVYISKNNLKPKDIKSSFSKLFIFLGSSFFVFILLSPYTFISWSKFVESMAYESKVVSGKLPVPYTLQFTNTTPYLFQIKNLLWQMGPILFISLIGLFYLWTKAVNKRKYLIFLIFPTFYFVYVGSWHTKFVRYMLPIIPFLIISASFLLLEIQKRNKLLGNLVLLFFTSLTILWSLSFFSIYSHPQTRIEASRYIYKNIPKGSTLLVEHWDDGLPVNLSKKLNRNSFRYNLEEMEIYDNENPTKVNYYANKLSSADYLVINSRRLYGTLINLPIRYPITSYYYKLLFSKKLGYEIVAEFTSYPSIFGVAINDDSSEETFQVYDHPKVIIFKNTQKFTDNKLRKILSRYVLNDVQ